MPTTMPTIHAPEDSADAPAPEELIRVDGKRVACDGGGGALGHPRVWLHLGEDDQISCTYCSRHYVRTGSAADTGA
ncbi:MAG: zinc-finger domain-containing protein [Alphaproteobacteria bacterium]|nr:zinc-finger domain-containing protein [Alphaproteobacteria bacterium]